MKNKMTISVSDDVLSGNLFDVCGYDENKSADNLAALMGAVWTERLKTDYPGAEIDVEVESRHNVSGCSHGLSVTVEIDGEDDGGYEGPKSLEIQRDIENSFNSDNIWSEQWDDWAVPLTIANLTENLENEQLK